MKNNCFILIVLLFFVSCSKEYVVSSDSDEDTADISSEVDVINFHDDDFASNVDNDFLEDDTEILDEDIDADKPKEYAINWGTEYNDRVIGAILSENNEKIYITGSSSPNNPMTTDEDYREFIIVIDLDDLNEINKKVFDYGFYGAGNVLLDQDDNRVYWGGSFVDKKTVNKESVNTVVLAMDAELNIVWSLFGDSYENTDEHPPYLLPVLFCQNDIIVVGVEQDQPVIARFTPEGKEVWKKVLLYHGGLYSCVTDIEENISCVGYANPDTFYGGELPEPKPAILTRPLFVKFSQDGLVVKESLFENLVAFPGIMGLSQIDGDLMMSSYSSFGGKCYLSVLNGDGTIKYDTQIISNLEDNCNTYFAPVLNPFGERTMIRTEFINYDKSDFFISWHDRTGKKIKERHIQGNREELPSPILLYVNEAGKKKRYIVGSSNSDEFSYNGSNGDYDIFIIVTDLMR